jgi:hypothetical protein
VIAQSPQLAFDDHQLDASSTQRHFCLGRSGISRYCNAVGNVGSQHLSGSAENRKTVDISEQEQTHQIANALVRH